MRLRKDTSKLKRRVDKLTRRARDASPAFAEIRELMLSEIEENFEQEGGFSSPDSPIGGDKDWPDLEPSTKKKRARKGKWPGKILQVSGQLAASITGDSGRDYAQAGTNKEYAAIQHYGGQAGRNRSVTIEPRPYMHIPYRSLEEAREILEDFFSDG